MLCVHCKKDYQFINKAASLHFASHWSKLLLCSFQTQINKPSLFSFSLTLIDCNLTPWSGISFALFKVQLFLTKPSFLSTLQPDVFFLYSSILTDELTQGPSNRWENNCHKVNFIACSMHLWAGGRCPLPRPWWMAAPSGQEWKWEGRGQQCEGRVPPLPPEIEIFSDTLRIGILTYMRGDV